ncbi:MAG: hypothetical protein IJP27_02610, partial [Clostridia bacterium]|nr:hypothetical protein [Clostridia bacterium]
MRYLDYVNIKMGTHSVPDRSCGNTLPLVAVPFGMNHFTVKSRSGDDRWFFHADDVRCYGIRLTHQPSPWIGDYASLDLLPFAGAHDGLSRFSSYDARDAVFSPAYLKLPLSRYGVTAELVPTLRGGVLRASWNTDPRFPGDRTRRFYVDLRDGEAEVDWESGTLRFINKQFRDRRNEDLPENFRMYGVLKFDAEPDRENSYIEESKVELAFKGLPEQVECRFATSFISTEVAEYSLEKEVGCTSFEQLRAKAEEEWEGVLSKIAVEAEEA